MMSIKIANGWCRLEHEEYQAIMLGATPYGFLIYHHAWRPTPTTIYQTHRMEGISWLKPSGSGWTEIRFSKVEDDFLLPGFSSNETVWSKKTPMLLLAEIKTLFIDEDAFPKTKIYGEIRGVNNEYIRGMVHYTEIWREIP